MALMTLNDEGGGAARVASPARVPARDASFQRPTTVSLVVASEVAFHREALSAALGAYGDLHIAGLAADVNGALALVERESPNVLFVDSPSDRHLSTLASNPVTCGLVLSAGSARAPFKGLQRHGLVGPQATLDELHAVVTLAARSPASAVEAPLNARKSQAFRCGLTGREREVFDLIARGCSNKEIAGTCCISLATVKNHVHSILGKLQCQRRSQLITLAP
jgi:two-component system nitrate/nitrite response regulator NarL